MTNPLTLKLEQFTRFEASECEELGRLTALPSRTYARREVILAEGAKVNHIVLVTEGLAARSKTLRDGSRQTMAFLVPGDLCDIEVFVLDEMDHDIIALAETRCVLIPASHMKEILSGSSNLTRALWWSTMTDSAVLRERIVDHGSRSAREQIAHIFCELLIRFRMAGQTTNNSFPFPLTQEDLGEATGLTLVHVNRILKDLRIEGLINWKGKVLTVPDPQSLMKVALFNARYLHLTRTRARDPGVSDRLEGLVATKRASLR
jgi:CRP-like cAMP-binding protein